MALQILEKNGTFHIHGKINAETTKNFIIHFDYVLDYHKMVIVNIDNVQEIDKEGCNAIKMLYKIAMKNNKLFSVIGYSGKEIYQNFENNRVA